MPLSSITIISNIKALGNIGFITLLCLSQKGMVIIMNMHEIGSRMRETREACGFSVEKMIAGLNISAEIYTEYENSGKDIPISVLYHISNKCKVDLNELITGSGSHINTLTVVKRGEGQSVNRYDGYTFENLAFTFRRKLMEPLLVTVEPSEEDPAAVIHEGQEFNMVLEGKIELIFNEKRILLQAGDSVYFNPAYPHGQRAVGGKARFLTVIAE